MRRGAVHISDRWALGWLALGLVCAVLAVPGTFAAERVVLCEHFTSIG